MEAGLVKPLRHYEGASVSGCEGRDTAHESMCRARDGAGAVSSCSYHSRWGARWSFSWARGARSRSAAWSHFKEGM